MSEPKKLRLMWCENVRREIVVDEQRLAELLGQPVEVIRQAAKWGGFDHLEPDSLYDDLAEFDDEADYDVERDGFQIQVVKSSDGLTR